MNPFDGGHRPNPYDQPVNLSAQSGGAADHRAVLFDAATQQASPAGKAMIDLMMGQLRAEAAERHKALKDETAKTLAALVAPYQKRIAALERQLAVERDQNAKAIEQALGGFLDDAPSLGDLERMAATHRKTMEAKR